MNKFETRFFKSMAIRLSEGDSPTLEGHIAVFNQLSEDFGGWREKIEPGAFTESIGRDDIRALWNHENDLVLGRNTAGTLTLSEDETGLFFKNTPPDTAWFKDRAVSIRRKDVTGASFAFYTESDQWEKTDGVDIRTLKKVTLVEVSPGVTFPAYPQTDVAIRSLEAWRKTISQESGQPLPFSATLLLRNKRLRLNELSL
jgi:HK97 family phage prohead protease